METVAKVMNYEIIKPVDTDWDTLGKILRDTQHAVWKTKNRAVQMAWDFKNFSYGYKQRFGKQLKFSELGTGVKSQTSDTYAFIKEEFPTVPSNILGSAIRDANKRFEALTKDILSGNVSIPSFKRDTPIPIREKMIKLSKDSSGKYYAKLSLLSKEGAKKLGIKTQITTAIIAKHGSKYILERLLSGKYKLCDSSILRKKKKWYLSLTYKFESENSAELVTSNVMGIDLGAVNTAVMAFNHTKDSYAIEGSEIKEHRKRIEKRRKELLRQGKYCGEGRRGHGRVTRIKPIEKLREKHENFRNTTNHKYAKYIVEQAVKHQCGTIQLEKLSGINKKETFLEAWTYYDLQQKIEYKAKERGIEVKYIEPKYTSQRCSECGHIAEGNRKSQSEFECVVCGFKANADYNAARNIATLGIEEIIKKELREKAIKRKAM